jgi:hypothetical protein
MSKRFSSLLKDIDELKSNISQAEEQKRAYFNSNPTFLLIVFIQTREPNATTPIGNCQPQEGD